MALLAQSRTDSVLKLLDDAIKKRSQFAEIKELRIDSLKAAVRQNSDIEKSYILYARIFEEYKKYNLDSALWVAKKKNAIAARLNKVQLQYESQMNIAEVLGKMGMYKETFDIMDRIKRSDLDKNQWSYYFHLFHSIYSLLLHNALSQQEKEHYQGLITLYKDSLLEVTDPQTLAHKLVLNGKLTEQGKYPEALALMNRCYEKLGANDAETGAVAYGISEVYGKTGKTDLQKEYLAVSAVADIRKAVKSYIALQKLAVILYKQGDLERAYAYIRCAMEDASFARARFRMIEVSEALPIIVASYDKKMKEEKDRLFKYLILISVLSFVLLLCIVFIYKQLQKNYAARLLVKKKNEELILINDALKELNKKLSESDQVKEIYIGYVFNLCSSYINKLENYRVSLNKKLKAKQTDEVLKMTGNPGLVTNELKEFFQNFDTVFLDIYPNFIDEFNGLLKAEEQIIPKSGDILTPELRVFALLRLGISDSSKIADFLHYSPQTVYNYKLKIKNKLAVSKETFSVKIHQIGK
ncbi:DUF6377 domain-containing protein [Niabella aquatica]